LCIFNIPTIMVLQKDFYRKNTITLAKDLLGTFLVHDSSEGTTIGRIVEVEAYLGADDPASHTYRGQTPRNRAMFGEPGHAYIYFTYGMYYCFNVTAAESGVGHGILVRAVEPVDGIEIMGRRRKSSIFNLQSTIGETPAVLTNGPAKLVIAMGITKDLYGHDLTMPPLYILSRDHFKEIEFQEVVTTTRVGIKEGRDKLLRFYIKGNRFVSKI
jgi:DNA-3-methyladenine glycosylase